MFASLRRLLHLRPGEALPVALFFGWYFTVIGASFTARAVRDSLFLAHLGADRLPTMYMISPVVAAVVGPAYVVLQGRIRRDLLVLGTPALAAGLALAARALVGVGDWFYYALFVGVNVFAGFVAADVWAVASDRFTSRDAKRLFGLIGAGGTAANVLVGAAVTVLAPWLGAENLLYVVALLAGVACALGLTLRRLGGEGFRERRAPGPVSGAAADAPGTAHLKWVGLAAVLSTIVVTLVDFQFKAVTAAAFGDDRAGMVRFFGLMSVGSGIVQVLVQVLVTRLALSRLGVAGAMAILPAALVCGETGLLVVPGLMAATALKGAEETFRFTVNDAASQLLFLPASTQARSAWRARVDARWKPAAQLVLGAAILAYRAALPGAIGPTIALAGAALGGWFLVLARMRPAWLESLRQTLRTRPGGLDADPTADEVQVLAEALRAPDAESRLAGLAALGRAAERLPAEVSALVGDPDARVRAAAAAVAPAEAVRACLDDPDAMVAAAALRALVEVGDPEARARARALAGGAPADRLKAAHALGAGAGAELLGALVGDPEPAVRAAALAATVTGSEAALAAVVGEAERPPAERRAAAAALGRLGTPAAAAELLRSFAASPAGLRDARAQALAGARRAEPGLAIDEAGLDAAIEGELRGAYETLAAAEAVGSLATPGLPERHRGALSLLQATLLDRVRASRDRVLRLVEARLPEAPVATVRANLVEADATRRANALELLDGLLGRDLRQRLVPLFDDGPVGERLAAAGRHLAIPRRTAAAWIGWLRADPSPWLREASAWYDVTATDEGAPGSMLTTVEKVLVLKRAPIFSAVDTEELAAIARVAEEVSFEAGTDLVVEGHEEDSCYFLVSGTAQVFRGGTAITVVREGAIVGEIAFLDPGPRAATVTAEVDLVALRLTRDAFVEILGSYPQVPLALLRVVARRLRRIHDD